MAGAERTKLRVGERSEKVKKGQDYVEPCRSLKDFGFYSHWDGELLNGLRGLTLSDLYCDLFFIFVLFVYIGKKNWCLRLFRLLYKMPLNGWLINSRTILLTVLEVEVQDVCQLGGFWWWPSFGLEISNSPLYPHMPEGAKKLNWTSLQEY